MSKTGTYAYRDGKVVKISNRTPKLGYVTEANLREPFVTADITGKPTEYRTRGQLYADMKRYNVRPVGNTKRDYIAQTKKSDPRQIEKRIAETVDKVIQEKGFNVPG